jgi:dTDP-glucose 4,6-dehydratase
LNSILVTGAAGFIGSSFVEVLLGRGRNVIVLDSLTYAGHRENLSPMMDRIQFVHGDIRDRALLDLLFTKHHIGTVVNLAAESHVDRSIENAAAFVETNVCGVMSLLDASLRMWEQMSAPDKEKFRFIQVSTDEVFGSLGEEGCFTEKTPYGPTSPYSASKAGGDHLARAWFHTYGLPTIITNCSNNYGPRQYPEKLIPHMINCALQGRPLPVYGDGRNVRDWIHVRDHCEGILLAIENGRPGESYCFGGRSERRNIQVVQAICDELDRVLPKKSGGSYREQIAFVGDRKGHDWRYAIDDSKAETELGFKREYWSFEDGLKQTVDWYLENQAWMRQVLSAGHKGIVK